MPTNYYYSRRQQLASVFEDTMDRIKQSLDFTNATNFSIHNQQFIPESAIISISDVPKADKPANIIVSRLRSFEAAAQYIGKRTAVLNFASATNPGGGVEKGASAQEECLCRVSTLYPCLADQKMRASFYTPHRKNGNTLHNDDIIYTPNVLVIKDDDHNLLSEPFSVDIISCADLTCANDHPINTIQGILSKCKYRMMNYLLCMRNERERFFHLPLPMV